VKAGLDPLTFTMEVVQARVAKHGDLFEGVLKTKQRLNDALRALA
jgi:DNA primase